MSPLQQKDLMIFRGKRMGQAMVKRKGAKENCGSAGVETGVRRDETIVASKKCDTGKEEWKNEIKATCGLIDLIRTTFFPPKLGKIVRNDNQNAGSELDVGLSVDGH